MMPNRFFFLSIVLLFPVFVFSQKQTLNVRGTGTDLYLDHNVEARENFFSIGRLYNVSPRELATYNRLSMDKGLNIGQHLKIPLNQDNFSQNTNKSVVEALVPIYHKVASGETLFRIGVNFNDVSLADLKRWNKLPDDNIKKGASLIIGFLRVSKSESGLAKQDFSIPGEIAAVQTKQNVPAPASRVKQNAITETAVVKKENPASASYPVVVTRGSSPANSKAGFFITEYEQNMANSNLKSLSGSASVFKSTSGWQDNKYYCFNNDAVPGSIIKVSVQGSPGVIYAKVLDSIPDIKQNEGLTLVLSNAAADALGVSGDKFAAEIQYYN